MSKTTDLVDYLVATVPVPTGMARDTAGVEPIHYEPAALYGWSLPETFAEESPEMDRDNFTVVVSPVVASEEDASELTDRSVTLALGNAAEAIVDWVRANRQDHAHNPQWWDDLQARVMWPGLRGLGWRSLPVQLSGYRFVS